MADDMKNIIRTRRKELGFSQDELAKNVMFQEKQSMQ